MRDKPDNRPDLQVAERAASEWSVLSTAELVECGLTRQAISRRVEMGWLHWKHRGVYAIGHPNIPLEGEFLAAVKACGDGAVLSHYSAATLWGMVDWDDRAIEVTVFDTTPRVHPGLCVHRTRYLDSGDVRRRKGIPVTAPVRTALDLCSVLRYRAARRAVRQGLGGLRRFTIPMLLDIADRQGRRPGAVRLRRIIATAAPTRSELEDVVLDLILKAGLPKPGVNVPMRINGRTVVPDFRWPQWKLVVEADSRAWHGDPLARQDDAERQALLEAEGEQVERVTWAQATAGRAETIHRLISAASEALTRSRLSGLFRDA
jgi:Transcriptional regulator, AbiEi antitoxin